MASLLSLLNRLLPFATPGTPVLQDVLHLAAICTLLYFAPQIQERLQTTPYQPRNDGEHGHRAEDLQEAPAEPQERRQPNDAHLANDATGEGAAHPAVDAHFGQDDDVPARAANDHIEEGRPGPAQAPIIPDQRNVGAKKAKALARRDQRRAYNEFQRSQGDAQRARDAEGAEERERAQAAERERRSAAEAALEAKKAKEREGRRAKEEAERLDEQRRREQAVELVRERLETDRMCDLFRVAREVGVDDEDWVERIVRSSGMLGRRGDVLTMITGMGWAVRVSAADMQRMYDEILKANESDETGRIEPERFGRVLEMAIRNS